MKLIRIKNNFLFNIVNYFYFEHITKSIHCSFSFKLNKIYNNNFYFFFPSYEEDDLYINTYFKTNKRLNYAKRLRFKPGYQVIFRYYRLKWLNIYYKYNFRQVRLTKIIYLFYDKNTNPYNKVLMQNTNRKSYNEVSKNFLNWKYIV